MKNREKKWGYSSSGSSCLLLLFKDSMSESMADIEADKKPWTLTEEKRERRELLDHQIMEESKSREQK